MSEKILEQQCENYLDARNIVYIRIPDSLYGLIFGKLKRHIPKHVRIMIARFIGSVPDLTILLENGKYICVELKVAKGVLSDGQIKFCRRIGEENYHVIRSYRDFVELIEGELK